MLLNQLRELIMDSDYEDLLAKRAETLAMIRYLINYIRSLITSLQTELEPSLHGSSHEGKQHEPVNEIQQTCNCCGSDRYKF